MTSATGTILGGMAGHVPSLYSDLRCFVANQINRPLLLGNGGRGLDGNGADDGSANRDAAQNSGGVVARKVNLVVPQ